MADILANNNKCKSLILRNHTSVGRYNLGMLERLLRVGSILMAVMLILTLFNEDARNGTLAYVFGLVFFVTLVILKNLGKLDTHVRTWLYFGYTVAFLVTIYISVIGTPGARATALLGIMCLAPMTFIDYPIRMNIYMFCVFLVHTALAFAFKNNEIARADTINSFCFTVLGTYVGNAAIRIKLKGFEAQRQLTVEKTTDVLTGLGNRRRLFEQLGLIRDNKANRPQGVMMLDIDYFKAYNDANGHAAGDHCLSHFGQMLRSFEETFPVCFYRYGGEEFVCFVYSCDEESLTALAQQIRTAIQNADKKDVGVTASIGIVYCDDPGDSNYEHWIEKADVAVYTAKYRGRNSVVCYSSLGEDARHPLPEKRVSDESSPMTF